jgi:parallel beta helix pectate lyase-like protein
MNTLLRLSVLALSVFLSIPALAASRVFVSSTGRDIDPCSLVSPCRSFQAGINAVDPGGEVVVLDSAGYGTMVIAKAVQVIVPPGIHAGITAINLNAIIVSAGPADVVVLRGLYVSGGGNGNGISFSSGKALHVDNCVINGFTAGNGLFFGAAGQLEMKDTIVRENTNGVLLFSTSGIILATLDRVHLERNANFGLLVEDNARATLRDSVVANNLINGAQIISVTPAVSAQLTVVNSLVANNANIGVSVGGGTGTATVTVADSTITSNPFGLVTQTNGTLQISNSTIARNATGVSAGLGTTLLSRGNNTLISNTADGAFTGTFLPK